MINNMFARVPAATWQQQAHSRDKVYNDVKLTCLSMLHSSTRLHHATDPSSSLCLNGSVAWCNRQLQVELLVDAILPALHKAAPQGSALMPCQTTSHLAHPLAQLAERGLLLLQELL